MTALSNSHISLDQVEMLNLEYYLDGLAAKKAEKAAVRQAYLYIKLMTTILTGIHLICCT